MEGGKNPVALDFKGSPSKTKQSFAQDVDINRIIAKFLKTGQVTGQFREPGSSLDVSGAVDYKNALNIVLKGKQTFSSLSGKVRARFENDPAKFLEFMADPKNKDEAIALGLVTAPKAVVTPPPIKVEVVNPSK